MSQELDLREYLGIVLKRIWMIAGIVIAVTVLAGVYSIFFKQPVYEASTKIIVNRTTASLLPNAVETLDLNEINTNIRMIDTYKEIIKTPAIMDKVAEKYPQFQLTSEQLMSRISVSSVNNTQVMTLAVKDDSYQRAAEIVNAVSVIFQQEIPSLFNVKNVSILNQAKVDPAVTPAPVSPNIPLNIALAFIVSLMVAVGIAFLLEYLDDTVKSENDVLRLLELPTLAEIAKVNVNEKKTAEAAADKTYRQAGELERVPVGK